MQTKKTLRILKISLIAYLAVGIAIYHLQDLLFFHPVPLAREMRYDFGLPYREVNLAYDGDANINIIQFTTDSAASKGVVLYLHGNRRNIGWYARHAAGFTKRGFEVWMVDYPGYGKSTGRLEEEMLHAYALQLYKLARKDFGPDSILIYGRSLGTGIAARLAVGRPARRLLLETPYYSFSSVVAGYLPIYPMERMIRMRLPTCDYLPQVHIPVTIFHGTTDLVIPYRNARRLEPLLKEGDEFITIPGGGHNDLGDAPLYRRKLDSLLMQ